MTTGLLFFATVMLLLEALRRRDGVVLAIGIFLATHFTLRSLILAAGLDVPYPPYLFVTTSSRPFHEADLIVTAWIVCLLVFSFAGHRSSAREETPAAPLASRRPVLLMPLVVVTIGSVLLLVGRHGGLTSTERYVRLGDNGSGGTGIFLLAPSVLLVVSLMQLRGHGRRVTTSALLGLLSSAAAFVVLGSRTPVIALIIAIGLGAVIRARSSYGYSLRVLAIPLLLAIAIPVLAVTLRNQRDAALAEHLNEDQAPSSSIDTVSRSINANYYDSLVLAVRDVGVIYPRRSVSRFLTDTQALVPHALIPGKAPFVSSGKWLRRQYEPQRINGWPVGAPGDWYLALGGLGIIVGGVVTVGATGLLRRLAERLTARTELELAICWGFLVLPGGVDEQFIARLAVWVLVPAGYCALVRPLGFRPRRPTPSLRHPRRVEEGVT